MRELVLALALFAALAGSAVVIGRASSMELLWFGGVFVAGGLVFSVPCAVRYHLLLYRTLAPRGALDRHWLFNPTGHHMRLTRAESGRVLPWFYAGAIGWGLSIMGCVLMGVVVFLNE